jgi:hypothetical protein
MIRNARGPEAVEVGPSIRENECGALQLMAVLARHLHEKRALYGELTALLEPLGRARICPVKGEADLLVRFKARLEQLLGVLEAMEDGAPEEAAARLENLRALHNESESEWQSADQIRNDLQEKARLQAEVIRTFSHRLDGWSRRVEELRKRLAEALAAKAPVMPEVRERQQLEELLRQAKGAYDEGDYPRLSGRLAELDKKGDLCQQLIERISDRRNTVQDVARQSELLLLQSPLDVKRRIHYTALLRTPSEDGAHGVNFRETSTLSESDRKTIGDSFSQFTRPIAEGLARYLRDKDQDPPHYGDKDQDPPPAAPAAEVVGPGPGDDSGGVRKFVLGQPPAGEIHTSPIDQLKDIGDLMYRLIVPDQMQDYLRNNKSSLVVTTNDLELPWELMHLGHEFLCLDRPVARMPMGAAIPRQPRGLAPTSDKVRFLLIYSDPYDNLQHAKREVEMIDHDLKKDMGDEVDITLLKKELIKGAELNRILRRGEFQVIHYAGHATFDREDADLSGLLLPDSDVYFAQKIRRLLEGNPLVFLNACESGATANERSQAGPTRGYLASYLQKPAEGLASAFIYGGALGCIGTLWPVYDGPAARFAVQFYLKVLEGHTLGEAVRLARDENRKEFPKYITWASFVLYGDPRFRLPRHERLLGIHAGLGRADLPLK